jgi:RHS repeat-associated protein
VLQTYAYPSTSNKLTNVKQGTVTKRAFAYDAAGNKMQDLRGVSTYNDAGRIKSVTGAGTASYLYDGFQKLRYKSQGGNVTNYLWDSFGHIIAEHNGTGGAALREYIWLGDTPLAVNEGVNLSYVHGDHLDRPVAMTTSGGPAIAWAAKYDPFGNVVSITSPTAMPLRFPGQYFQIEDGLSYNWHRNYDPSLGRYSQPDPLGFVDGPGVYNYAGGSPAMKVDPKGLLTSAPPMSTPEDPNKPKQCETDCIDAYFICLKLRGAIRGATACAKAKANCDKGLPTIFAPGTVGRP